MIRSVAFSVGGNQGAAPAATADLFVASDFVQSWFPEPIRQLFVVDPAYPAYLKSVGARYQSSLFAKRSLNNGYVVIADGFAPIHLHTM